MEFYNWNAPTFQNGQNFNIDRNAEWLDFTGQENSFIKKNKLNQHFNDGRVKFLFINTVRNCGIKTMLYNKLKEGNFHGLIATYLLIGDDGDVYAEQKLEHDGKVVKQYASYQKLNIALAAIEIDNYSFINHNGVKVIVIDHAERLREYETEIYNLGKFLLEAQKRDDSACGCIVIMLSKGNRMENDSLRWTKFPNGAASSGQSNIRLEVCLRGSKEPYYYDVFSKDEVEAIIDKSDISNDNKQILLNMLKNGSNNQLYLAYYLDRILAHGKFHNLPKDFNCNEMFDVLYKQKLEEILQDIERYNSNYCYRDFFDKIEGETEYIFAEKGIDGPMQKYIKEFYMRKHWGQENKREEFLSLLKKESGEKVPWISREDAREILEEVFKCLEQGDKTSFCEFFINPDRLFTAMIVGSIVKDNLSDLEDSLVERAFDLLCVCHDSNVNDCNCNQAQCKSQNIESCHRGFKVRREIALIIGELIEARKTGCTEYRLSREKVKSALERVFATVTEAYVLPQVNNNNRISVCPITNFEYKLFVEDGGYEEYIGSNDLPERGEVCKSYYKTYSKILDFITDGVSDKPKKLGEKRALCKVLRGATKGQYQGITHALNILAVKDGEGKYQKLDELLGTYYGEDIKEPSVWGCEDFCNPLQPVVGVSLPEAKAYAKWLSDKTGKFVRVFQYEDFINVVGGDIDIDNSSKENEHDYQSKKESSKKRFAEFKEQVSELKEQKLFNCGEYRECYYEVPSRLSPLPVGMIPNNQIEGLYDFCGNINEMHASYYQWKSSRENRNEVYENGKKVEKEEWQKIYSCSGGSWQQSSAHFPDSYMGQYTGFTRNNDIGFRIVIYDQAPEISNLTIKKDFDAKGRAKNDGDIRDDWEDDAQKIEYKKNVTQSEIAVDLEKINLEAIGDKKVSLSAISAVMYNDKEKEQVRIYSINGDTENPSLALLNRGYDIFAYRLSLCTPKIKCTAEDTITLVRSQLKENGLSKSKRLRSNRELADEVYLLTYREGGTECVYIASRIDIAGGFILLESRKKHKNDTWKLWGFCDGKISENKIFKIVYNVDQEQKSKLFDEINKQLSKQWFMPDWINLSEITGLCFDKKDETKENMEAIDFMEILAMIDTADMHRAIADNDKSK